MKATKLTIQELATTLIAMTDERDLKTYVFRHLAGNDNRFNRQDLIQELTGEKHHLVKCGVNYVVQHVQAYQTTPQNDLDVSLAKATPSIEEESASEVIDLVTPTTEPTAKAEKSEKLPAYQIEVGTPVIRKKCKRKGVIKANADGKMEIELEDGSIRKPASGRFYQLYNFQNN